MTEEVKSCPFCGGKEGKEMAGEKKEEFPRLRAVLEKAEFPEGMEAEFRLPNFEPSSYSCRACKSGTDEEIARLR